MLGIIYRLLGKGVSEAPQDFVKEKPALRPERKASYKKWKCRGCEHSYLYQVLRCPLCESDKIEETARLTRSVLAEDTLGKNEEIILALIRATRTR